MANFLSDPNNIEATMGGALPNLGDPNSIGALIAGLMDGQKQITNMVGKHMANQAGQNAMPNASQFKLPAAPAMMPQGGQAVSGLSSQLGSISPDILQGLNLPGLRNPFGNGGGQTPMPQQDTSQDPAQPYFQSGMEAQQKMADALRQVAQMHAPQMGAPVNKHNAGLLAIASLLPLLFAKNKSMGLAGAVQGFTGQANQEQQREFQNATSQYQQQRSVPLTEADIQQQIANQQFGLGSAVVKYRHEAAIKQMEEQGKQTVAQILASSRDDASKLKFVQGMWDRFPMSARAGLYGMVQDIDPDMAKILASQPGFIDQLNQSKATLNKAHSDYFTQAAAYKKVDAATLPALRTALQTRYAAAGKLDDAHAANFAESTILMPAESQAKVTQALASAQNLQSEAADRPVRTANDYARVQATMRGQDAENVRAGLKSLHDHATELKSQADQYVKILTSANASDDQRTDAAKNLEFVNGQIARLQESYKTLAGSLNMPALPQPQVNQAPTRARVGTGKSRSGVTFTYTPQQ